MRTPQAEPLTYSIPEAAKALGISKTLAYELALKGDLPTLKLGTRRVVPRAALERMLAAADSHQAADQFAPFALTA